MANLCSEAKKGCVKSSMIPVIMTLLQYIFSHRNNSFIIMVFIIFLGSKQILEKKLKNHVIEQKWVLVRFVDDAVLKVIQSKRLTVQGNIVRAPFGSVKYDAEIIDFSGNIIE